MVDFCVCALIALKHGLMRKERKVITLLTLTSGEQINMAEGDRMLILTERQRRKSGDKWYENDRVILFQKIE